MPAVRRGRNEVERKIHFYRADCGTDAAGDPIPFQPAAALNYIDGLDFAPFDQGGRYYEDRDNIYCAWVESNTRVQFAVIRRGALPHIEEEGIVRALDISETAGLVEQIHVRFFPHNIVGFDFNFYGPRLPRLATYLNGVAEGESEPVFFKPLLRQDVSEELSDDKELRLFSLRIRRSQIDAVAEADESLGQAFQTVAELTDGSELEIIVRPKPYSKESIGADLMETVRRLAGREDIRNVASDFHVKVAEPGGAAANLDLLGDAFIFDSRILRQTAKGRALDPEDAYAKIEAAYAERRDDLQRAADLGAG